MEKESELVVKEVFRTLSGNAKKLLIAMCHPTDVGAKKDAITANSDLGGKELDDAMRELRERDLLQSGKLEGREFIIGEGDRHRLPPGVRKQTLKDIVEVKENF